MEGEGGEVFHLCDVAEPTPEVVFVDDAEAYPASVCTGEEAIRRDEGHVWGACGLAGRGAAHFDSRNGQRRVRHGQVDIGGAW